MTIIHYLCPQCNQPVNPQARYCGHCGVDIALAAVYAESQVELPEKLLAGMPVAPEILVPRLGDYLMEKGLLASADLELALAHQRKKAAEGQPILLGQALRDLNLIDDEALDQAVTVQIMQLQSALRQANRQLEQRVQERTLDLRQALNRLTELNQLKANFIANISHELRTPLTHLKGYLDILADGGLGSLNKGQSDALAVLRRAEARLERRIEDLIHFSLASRGELSLKLAPVSLVEIIKTTVERNQYKAKAGKITMEACIPEDLPSVSGDEEKLLWVIAQLIDNAIKFTPKGGKVVIQALQEENLVRVAVSDTGIGIPADRIHEIFEPFHQLDGSATRRYAGTGLGLALSNRIMEAHGRQINVESLVGKGSRFEFSLPVAGNR